MAALEGLDRPRDSLPSIHSLDFEKSRAEKSDSSRFPTMAGLTVSTAPSGSPTTIYSAPPPPYSNVSSTAGSTYGHSGYISPPETTSRRSTRDDKDSQHTPQSLPSISEALKSADVPQSAQSYTSSAPPSAVAPNFAEAPKGPGNPFSQHSIPSNPLRTSLSSNSGVPEGQSTTIVPPPPIATETRSSQRFNSIGSPRSIVPPSRPVAASEQPIFRSSFESEPTRPGYPFPDPHSAYVAPQAPSSTGFNFEHRGKFDDRQNPFSKSTSVPYGETVKRHLDVYDAELALNEIGEASARTSEFAKIWGQRCHQGNRGTYYAEGLPPLSDVEDMIRHTHRVLDNLARVRDVAMMQQVTLSEQRARAARNDDEFHDLSDEYKGGGFAGGDAKKRRGKAAPPGRCHSCNRAETPEWRRGPDGARTLCNACGLHYAKLTRKMGASKAAVLTTSNLRPKTLNDTQP